MAEQKSLFDRLKTLFSTNVIVRNVGGKKLKVIDTARYQADGNPHTSKVIDRYGRLHGTRGTPISAYNQYNSFSATKIDLYTDYEAMDTDAIISSALDIYADECLGSDTLIPLLNDKKFTIKELYENNVQNFWVYGLDAFGNFTPSLAEKVVYKGKRQTYVVTLDDGTEIVATDNHVFVKSDNEQVQLKDLKVGDGLMVLPTKNSNTRTMKNYEMIRNFDGKFDYTHRIVSNKVPFLLEERRQVGTSDLHTHHIDFDKRNNEPSNLTVLQRKDHIRLHQNHNTNMWEKRRLDQSWMTYLLEKTREGHSKYWNDSTKRLKSEQQKKFMTSFVSDMTHEERCNTFANYGKKNGMFGKGHKLIGKLNGRYNESIVHFEDLDISKVEKFIFKNYNGSFKDNLEEKLRHNYGLPPSQFDKLTKYLCSKYNVKTVQSLPRKMSFLHYKEMLPIIRKYCIDNGITWREMTDVANQFDISTRQFRFLIEESGYKTFGKFLQTNNHKIVSIEKGGIVDVYDIVNVGDTHLFAIETNDGGKCYVHNCTLKNDFGNVLTIKTDNDNIRKILQNLFYDILNIEYNLWPWIRNLCKYGDNYLFLDIKEGLGVTNVVPLSSYEILRDEGTDPEHIYLTKFIYEGPLGKGEFQNYEIAHFRLLGDTNFLPYGKSILEGGRKLYKQLVLMEDAMLIHRIMRAPEKRVFKIDIGNIPPAEVDQYMQNIMNQMKKTPVVNEQTGQYNLKYNMQNILEDFYLPVRGGQAGTTIETLPGLQYQAIEDVEYLKNKIFAALKVPKAFLGYDEGLEGKATLAALDIRFARTIERIQRIVVSELTKIAIAHLYSQGYENSDLVNFELSLTGPSIIYEQEKIALMKERVDLANSLVESKLLSLKYIYKNIFNLSDDEADFEQNEIIEDIKLKFRQSQIESEGNDPQLTKESFGTPHDLATMNIYGGKKSQPINDIEVPEGGWPGAGRPPEHGSTYGTDDSSFGRDPIGKKDISKTLSLSKKIKHDYKGDSPLSLEGHELSKEMEKMIHSMNSYGIKTKSIISESLKKPDEKKDQSSLLDENFLLEEM